MHKYGPSRLKIYNDSQRAKSNSSGFNYMPYKSQWGESTVCVQQWATNPLCGEYMCVEKTNVCEKLDF